MSFKRYEILLPTRYNDGRPVEEEQFAQTRRDLIGAFGAITWYPDRLQGIWSQGGQIFEDTNIKVVIDVEDAPEGQAFFRRLKETLKKRFHQIDIWMVSYQVEIH
jgi:hypothetical protein